MSKRMKLGGSLAQIQRLQAVDHTVCPHPGKMGFERKAAAKKQARRRGQSVYKCQCGLFHLTSGRKSQ